MIIMFFNKKNLLHLLHKQDFFSTTKSRGLKIRLQYIIQFLDLDKGKT